MNEATLCYLTRQSANGTEVCLAEKKKRYVAGWLNAAGGHIDSGENAVEAVIRELLEEQDVVVTPDNLKLVAIIFFIFPGKEHQDLKCHVYTADRWQREPRETTEMGVPQWFSVVDLPFDRLPPADALWLPKALSGSFFEATYQFDKNFKPIGLSESTS